MAPPFHLSTFTSRKLRLSLGKLFFVTANRNPLLASGWAGFLCCVFQTCEPCLILVTVLFMCFSGQEVLLTEHALQRNQKKN